MALYLYALTRWPLLSAIAILYCATTAPSALAFEPASKTPPRETVLFPFDDQSLPFTKGLILTLMPGRKSPHLPTLTTDPKHPGKPVLPTGKKGDPDSLRAYFFGTVLHIGKQYHMWYSAHDGHKRQVCYAVSTDGLKWTKPKLGLADYNGSKNNNLVQIDGAAMRGMSALVVHDPQDPNPARRFKMVREIAPEEILAAVSPDGLTWTSTAGNQDIIKGSNFEPSGFIKRDGVYYLCGHGGPVPHPIAPQGYLRPQKRMMITLVSHDFETWHDAGHVSFRRDPLPPRTGLNFETHSGEQVHLGASLWDRGNVILGFYGQYHNPTNDRRTSVCDIGLVVSSNAIHYREPIPDFKLIPSFEEGDRAEPRLTQGQAFINTKDRTLHYYGIWTENDRNSPTGVRIATWPRDRLGYFSPGPTAENAHCISSPLTLARDNAKVFINATGLSAEHQLTVEILDEQMRPLPGYTAAEYTPQPTPSGLRLPLIWQARKTLENVGKPFRIRINWTGKNPTSTRLYAVYIE